MRMLDRVAMTTALLVPLIAIAGPAAAQNYRWDFGVNGGYSWYSNMLDDDDLDLDRFFTDLDLDRNRNIDANFGSGWLAGAQLGYWIKPNIGLRLNAAYSDRPLEVDFDFETFDGDIFDFSPGDLLDNVNLWSGSLDFMWRFRSPNMEFTKTEVLPYLALGLGAKWINPAGDDFRCLDGSIEEECLPFFIDDGEIFGGGFALDKQTKFMGLIGLGADIRVASNFAIRLEVNDRIYNADFRVLDFDIDDDEVTILRDVGKTVHEVGVQAGLHLLMGLERPQVVTVIPAPAPPPPPPPPPAEEAITVCVVDTDERWGLRMQSAYYRPTTRDTVVIMNGNRVPLARVVEDTRTARNADWYVRGQPLVLTIGTEKIEFLTYQGARTIAANQLAYLGTINGYPVYADRDEVASVISDLQNLHQSRNHDLSSILQTRKDLRDELKDVSFIYVPMDRTGCVFQALNQPEPVQKK